MDHFEEIKACVLKEGIVNTHAHHLGDSEFAGMTLERILGNSYVAWCGEAIPSSSSLADTWLDKVGSRSYYVSLSRALMKLYSMDVPLSRDAWDEYDRRIRTAHKSAQWHLDILKNICGYAAVVQDSYWKPGDNNGHPETFKPSYRVNYF
ncbi:MAG: hypothetical protein FWF26_03630, partial [Treponema sp.]|nr:hypothetical protein [Treponema sp.]